MKSIVCITLLLMCQGFISALALRERMNYTYGVGFATGFSYGGGSEIGVVRKNGTYESFNKTYTKPSRFSFSSSIIRPTTLSPSSSDKVESNVPPCNPFIQYCPNGPTSLNPTIKPYSPERVWTNVNTERNVIPPYNNYRTQTQDVHRASPPFNVQQAQTGPKYGQNNFGPSYNSQEAQAGSLDGNGAVSTDDKPESNQSWF